MSADDEKILILVVDKDDDIGRKAKVKTPLIGREDNVKAAISVLLNDPEEADANAIFGGIKLYDELYSKLGDERIEIATVSGLEGSGYEADLKLSREIDEVLSGFPADKCILVTDLTTEQSVIPIISSRCKILSVRNIVVKQSESVEKTWALIGKYLKMAIYEPRFSKMFLGFPGIFLLIIGMLYTVDIAYGLNIPTIYVTISILGFFMILRGFNLDTLLSTKLSTYISWFLNLSIGQIRWFATIISLIMFILSLYSGYANAVNSLNNLNVEDMGWAYNIAVITGAFISGSINLLMTAILISVFANAVFYLMSKYHRFWKMVETSVVTFWLWMLLYNLGSFLANGNFQVSLLDPPVVTLIIISVLGTTTMAGAFYLTKQFEKKFSSYFVEGS